MSAFYLGAGALIFGLSMFGGYKVATASFTRFDDLFRQKAKDYALDAKLGVKDSWKVLKSICYIESTIGLHPRVAAGLLNPSNIEGSKSEDGKSWGIMQVTLTTARQFDASATPEKLNNPAYSVDLACKYLIWAKEFLMKNKISSLEYLIKSYNQGVGNSQKEASGKSDGFADHYWTKFSNAHNKFSQEA